MSGASRGCVVRAVATALLLAGVSACTPELPDPQSAGAEVYRVRCGSCHEAYAPGALTAAMWDVQLERMQSIMARRGVNPLTEQERYLVTSYLNAHSADAPAAGAAPSANPPRPSGADQPPSAAAPGATRGGS